MPTAYSSGIVDQHLPLSLGNKCIDIPSTATVSPDPKAMHRFLDSFVGFLFRSHSFRDHSESMIYYAYNASSLSVDNSWGHKLALHKTWLCFQTRGGGSYDITQ